MYVKTLEKLKTEKNDSTKSGIVVSNQSITTALHSNRLKGAEQQNLYF